MPPRPSFRTPWRTAARWPIGLALTAWHYMWRTTPLHRWELTGCLPDDSPPLLPSRGVELDDVQQPGDGVGALLHRIYRTRIVGSPLTASQLMDVVSEDLDRVAPSGLASFQKTRGGRRLAVGDEYVVRMPGPWDGPVRVVSLTPTSMRMATLRGHLEAGQIEFRAVVENRSLAFAIESWARSGDRFSDLLYSHVGLAKEVQLHMWSSVLTKVVKLSKGRMDGGVVVTTRRLDVEVSDQPRGYRRRRDERRLAALAALPVNFAQAPDDDLTGRDGWRVDDLTEPLPHEVPGAPVDGGSWQIARRLMDDYQLADPAVVRAVYRNDTRLAGRNMLLQIHFLGTRFNVGVRVGEVYEDTREVDGRAAHVYGWDYRTLEGHFEQGQMHYEVWKWTDSGDVEFRLHAFSQPAKTGPWVLRTGFALVGRTHQLRFYRQICRRVRRLTEAQLQTRLAQAQS